jgi:hypothetical protein
MMEAVRTSESSVNSSDTRRYIPKDSHLHNEFRQELRTHEFMYQELL